MLNKCFLEPDLITKNVLHATLMVVKDPLIQSQLVMPLMEKFIARAAMPEISVPRDMPLPAARLLRQALEATAQLDGPEQAKPLPVRDRFDQDPRPFLVGS